MNYKINFQTQYNQFYVADKESNRKTNDTSFWSAEAYDDRLAIGNGILGIGTECYGPVRGEVVLLDNANSNFNIDEFDHIVEGGLEVKSGNLEILDCPSSNKQLEIKVKSGKYRVRVYSSNLDSVTGDAGNDSYKIEIWPDTRLERKVIKKYLSN